MERKGDLYIPVPIKRYPEILNIDGIGKREGRNIVISTLIGILLSGIVMILTKNILLPLAIIIFISFCSYIFQKKDLTNRNTIDRVKISHRFKKSQKVYLYKYHNIYEGVKQKD